MKRSIHFIAGLAVASLLCAAPASAQGPIDGEGSMQVGNATVTVGGGTAILTLPDVPSFVTLAFPVLPPGQFLGGFKFSDDFGDEIGWNVNASIAVPMIGANGNPKTVSLNGFWANIEDDHGFTCQSQPLGGGSQVCEWHTLVDNPNPTLSESQGFAVAGGSVTSNAERDVDQWGVSLESKWALTPGVMGVTRAQRQHYIALGADVRGIDQDLGVLMTTTEAGFGPISYTEDLDTRYYGAYAAWGGDFPRLLLGSLWERWGLHSTFQLRGGVYYADTDYDGRLVDNSNFVPNVATSALSLSDDDVAFIGGLTLETRKRVGQRVMLSLKSDYEYYSYVPEMAYNTVDLPLFPLTPGRQAGTVINDDDAFSMRTSLRLTIGLGPRELYQEPLK